MAWWSSDVWGGWGWTFVIGWGLASISFRPVFFPSAVGDLYSPLHILFLILLPAGVVLIVLSVLAATRRYNALKREETI